jgi:hypothetical protein
LKLNMLNRFFFFGNKLIGMKFIIFESLECIEGFVVALWPLLVMFFFRNDFVNRKYIFMVNGWFYYLNWIKIITNQLNFFDKVCVVFYINDF